MELLPEDDEVRLRTAGRWTPGTGGLATIHVILFIIFVTRGLATEAEARSSTADGPGSGKDVDHDLPGFETHPLLLGHCPGTAASCAATLNPMQAIRRSLPELAAAATALYRLEEPGEDLRVSIQMSPSAVGRTAYSV